MLNFYKTDQDHEDPDLAEQNLKIDVGLVLLTGEEDQDQDHAQGK